MRIGLFQFGITARDTLFVPLVNKGNMLRGSFGNAFRRLCCIPQCRNAATCPVMATCPYKLIFEPSPPPDSDRLSKNQDIPRPFVFRPDDNRKTRFDSGEALTFRLVLIGRAFEFIPYFVLSFRELAEQGLGLNRARCTLEQVEELEPVFDNSGRHETRTKQLYSVSDQLFRSTTGMDSREWAESRITQLTDCLRSASDERPLAPDHPPPLTSDRSTVVDEIDKETVYTDGGPLSTARPSLRRLTIRFLTPTFIRAEGQVIQQPEFHHVFKRLRDRINALETFFGEGPLDADFRGLGERAEKVGTISSHFEWVERARTSGKTRQRHELSGFVGEATYEGDLDEFLPWLALGELVHVGRHTAWGNGRFEVAAPPPP